jgi:DNA-binding transcriptional LysR family regulator
VAVADELNFSRAAARLHMAQPPLSAAIRRLEQEIGVTLFARSTREVKLTEAGAVFLEGARRTLASADNAVTAARRAAAGDVGSLRLGYNWSSRFDTLPALGRALKRVYPDVELVAEEMHPKTMADALLAGAIDAGLARYPELVAELSYRPVRHEPIVVLLSSVHPLAGQNSLDLVALADEFRMFPRELAPRLHDFYLGLCHTAGFEPRGSNESVPTRWTIGTWEARSVTLLPESVSRDLPDGVVAIPLASPPGLLETQVVWRSDELSPTVAAFVRLASTVWGAGGIRRPPPLRRGRLIGPE